MNCLVGNCLEVCVNVIKVFFCIVVFLGGILILWVFVFFIVLVFLVI